MTETKFEKFICWNIDALKEATLVDVGRIKETEIFHAIHYPLKASTRRGKSIKVVEEIEVVEKFKEKIVDEAKFQPVVGKVGTGKSHLVKYVYENVKNIENWKLTIWHSLTSVVFLLHCCCILL